MTTLLLTPFYFLRSLILHLWWSVSSIKFYENIFSDYKGYGLKYIFILSFFSSLICSAIFLDHLKKVQDYLTNSTISQEVENIDHIINQLPTIDYNGQNISVQEETPLLIYSPNNKKILAIDPSNQLLPSDKVKIPIIFTANKIVINLINADGGLVNTTPIKYDQIFGNQARVLTQEVIKSHFALILNKAPFILIYLLFPIMAILIFVNVLLDKTIIIITIYFFLRFASVNCSLKTCIRMVLFASGLFALLHFIIILTAPYLISALWLVQFWANLLMVLAILKVNNGKYKFFFF